MNSQTHDKPQIQDYSNSDITGKISAIHIKEDYSSNEITNSKFTDCDLPSGENYLFSVQRDINFDNVEFSFSQTKIGAIKIDHPGKISIRNCVFRKCFVNNGLGNAIYISTKSSRKYTREEEEDIIIEVNIENNYYDSCGNSGYVNLVESKLALMQNNTFDFSQQTNSCGAFRITCCGNITIIDNHFINTKAKGTILYEPESVANEEDFLIIQNCTFKECNGTCCYFSVQSESKEKITVSECIFLSCKKGSDDSIALGSNNLADSISLFVAKNEFIQCGINDENVYAVKLQINNHIYGTLIFENNVFNNSCGALSIKQNDGKVNVRNCIFKNLIHELIDFQSLNYLLFEDCFFDECQGSFEVKENVNEAEIQGCVFSDCINTNNNSEAVILISNRNCILNNNTVNFTSNEASKSRSGLHIKSHGNIEVTNNLFFKTRLSKNSSILIEDEVSQGSSLADSIVRFNYNTIENVGNVKNGIFLIHKNYSFNIDHNIIKECAITHYSTDIALKSKELVITNLTFIDCQAGAKSGGVFGLWIAFPEKTGKFTLLDCHFEHNSAIVDSQHPSDGCQPSGNGGGFAVGDVSIENIEFIADNCTFINNHAAGHGGALSIQSTLAATIKNCTFTNNQAERGGGAIYISPTKFIEPGKENNHTPLPSCTILGCKFDLNNDMSNKGHAIYFEFANGCTTIIKIDECEFTDNYNSESTTTPGGFTISCDSPTLNITNTKIEFTNPSFSTTGLKVEEHTETLTIQECELKEITGKPSCILSCNTITIDGLKISSQETTETAIQILKSNVISIRELGVQGQIESAIELHNSLPVGQSLQFDISDSSFQNSGNGIKFTDSFTSIHTLNLVSTFAKNTLISYSPTSNMNELLIHHLNFQGCTANEGSLINVADQINTINISYSEFESCRGKVFTISSPNLVVDNCNFKSHIITSDGCLRIESITNAQILNCNFSSTTTVNHNKEFKGGAIYVVSGTSTPEPEVIIRDSTFHITQNLEEGNSIYVEGDKARLVIEGCQFSEVITEYQFAIVTETQNIQMSDVTFNCNLPLLFKGIDRVHDIDFTDITCNRSPILIVPQDNTYTIDNVTFHNCKCTDYVIEANTDHFQISNSIIEFDESSTAKSCKGINLNTLGDHNIINTQFIKTNNHAIYYDQSKDAIQDKLLNITGCTFDACNEPGATCTIELGITQRFEFKENIFQNIQSGSFTVTITFDHFNEITFDSCHFINNSMNTNEYGGSGLRVFHRKNAQTHLFFNNCQWINNSNINDEYGGGAFCPGPRVSISPELTFTQCLFKENKAKQGGALSVQTMYPLHISGCTFEDNKATESSQNGGAIYLGPENPVNPIEICEITGSTFIGNSAASGKGHVLFVEAGLTTDLIIDSTNTFTNNNNDSGSGSAIYYNGKSVLHITFPTFSDEKLSRFIEFGEGCEATLEDVAFRGCQEKDGDGNAVKIGLNSKSVTLRSCTFTNCGTKGYVVSDIDGASVFEDCSFVFDGQTACCALDITTNKYVAVVGCTFNKNNNGYDASSKHGTLYYHPENPTTRATFTSCSFIQCSGNTNIAFSIRTSIEPEFSFITINNTGSEDSPSTNYIGEVYLTGGTSFNPEFCSINDNVASTDFGGGSAILVKSESDSEFILTYRSCQWTNNYAVYSKDVGNNRYNGVGGAYQHGFDSSSTNVLLEFNNCTFLNNKSDREGGALAIQVVKNVLITKCYFKGNRAGVKVQSSSLNLLDLPRGAGYGGALYIDPDFSQNGKPKMQFQIEESVFYGNEAVNGHAIYIRGGVETQLLIQSGNVFTDNGKSGSTIVSECNDLSIDSGVIFNFTDPSSSSRPYEFGPGSAAKYENLVFEDVSASNNIDEGNVINIADGVLSAFISNCTFRNCGREDGYVVTCYDVDVFEFYNCTITFDNPSSAIKGLGIFSPPDTRLMIEDCNFQRCKGGCIIVEQKNKEPQSYKDLDIKNVTFDEGYGSSNRAFKIKWEINHLKMDNIHVINSPQDGYICEFYLRIPTAESTFIFRNWEFNNNTAGSLFGGGSGMWIADDEKKSKLEITFENCVWTQNHAVISHLKDDHDVDNRKYYNGLGGAFQVGFSQTIANTILIFNGCTFENNTADSEGGALAIQTTEDCTIQHCIFKKNVAGAGNYSEAIKYGGAIFIDPDFKNNLAEGTRKPTSKIENCTFESNNAVSNAHAISLTGDDAEIEINNVTFIDNGDNSGSTLYSICPKLIFENVKFIRTNDLAPSTRAIELDVLAEITLDEVLFDNCKVIDRDGGAILLSNSRPSTANIDPKAIEKQEYSITNCKFVNCQARNGGSIFISEGVSSVSILHTEFKGGSVDSEGVAIYISSQVDEFRVDSSVKFVEQNDNGKFLISSYCSKFDISDLEIENGQFGSGIKGIKLNAGTVTINNVFFNKCTSAFEITTNVQQATINNCIFSDCYCGNQDGKQGSGQVVLVANTQCTFSNNILNFSNNINAITGIYFRSHGHITIENNKFINMRSSELPSTLCIDESRGSSLNDATFRFNNNLIQNTAKDGKFPFLYVDKKLQFTIDHNTFKDCTSDGYSIQIKVDASSLEMANYLELVNLTFQNCQSKSMTGGSTGLWLLFKDKKGSLTLRDCVFNGSRTLHKINNDRKDEGGHGGGFGMGLTTIDKMEITVDNCSFINNMAEWYGGGLYLRTSMPAEIINSKFIGNQAKLGGGALYISPDSRQQSGEEMSTCKIHGCKFERNIDESLKNGHAIQLRQQNTNIEAIFTIDQNCEFKDNGDINGDNNLLGYTIVSEVHTLELKDSTIIFSDMHMTTTALNISGIGKTTVTNILFDHVNSGLWHTPNPDFPAHTIYISSKPSEVEIDHCTFEYCGGVGSKPNIVDNGRKTTINDCNFINYYVGESRVGSVKVTSAGTHIITNCQTNNPWGDEGVFIYDPQEETGSTRKFTFANISIDTCYGDASSGNTNIALNFKFRDADDLDMHNVTIKNTQFADNPLVGIELANDMSEFTLNDFKFIGNTIRNSYGGGSGLKIINQNPETKVTLSNCLFERNTAQKTDDVSSYAGYGGAWMVGNYDDIKDIELVIDSCEFKSNRAERSGGAIYILTTRPATITDCQFTENTADENGGAIYINFNDRISPTEFHITGCTFKTNFGQWDATICVYKSLANTLIDITDCTFPENKPNKNIIYSYGENVTIHDMTFDINTNQNARPLCLGTNSKTEIYNVNFIRCSSVDNSEGSAIRAESTAKLLDIHECLFEDCQDYGSSVHSLCSPLLVRNCIFRCTGNNYLQAGLHIEQCSGRIEVTGCTFSHLKQTNAKAISPLHLVSNSENEEFIFSDLVFSDCSGQNKRCFSLTSYKPFTFENVTVKDNKLGNYLGAITLEHVSVDDEFIFRDCKWLDNKLNSLYGGGSGLWLDSKKRATIFSFENCFFERNTQTGNGGGFQDGKTGTTFQKYLNFRGCTFNNNEARGKGGAIAIQTVYPFTIDGCTFNNNNAALGGGAIYIETTQSSGNVQYVAESGSIKNCEFSNCVTESENGTILFIENSLSTEITFSGKNKVTNKGERGSVIYTQCKNLYANDLTFDFDSTGERNFRAALIAPGSKATFTNCKFTGTGYTTNSQNGHAVLAQNNAERVVFDRCTFSNCGNNNREYAIYSTSLDLQFIGSTIQFTNQVSSCGGICCTHFSKLTVTDSLFKDIFANQTAAGAGICYNYNSNRGDPLNCDVILSGTTFDNLMSKNGRAAFFKLSKYSMITNCTFKNMPVGNYILVIGHSETTEPEGQTILDNVVFMDNKASVTDDGGGGGIGFWVSQVDRCLLENCKFIRNENRKQSNGGALGYSSTLSTSKVALEFISCRFEDNKVLPEFFGGALYINAELKPVLIKSCVFSNTISDAAKLGGAIYISGATKQRIDISDTDFINMKATFNDKQNGNAIYIQDEASANVFIEGCTFTDCGTYGSVISSSGMHVYFRESTITFSSRDNACQGINVKYLTHFEFEDSSFKNCNAQGVGGAFSYRYSLKEPSTLETNYSENIIFRNTIIDNCESKENNGRALFITATSDKISFYNLTIQHVKSKTGFIFTLGHSPKISGAVLFEKCNFIDCSTNINGGDGGGLGFWCSDEDEIKFDDCLFQQLNAAQNGGAISFTQSDARRNTKLTFTSCLFDQNTAVDGSALYIDIRAQLNVIECNFTSNNNNNLNKVGGGCIFITSNCRNINIERTEFHQNTQNSAESTGNAIYFQNQNQLVGRVQDCKFINCGTKGSVVYSDGVDLEFYGNTISFTESENGCKGLHVPKSCNIHIANSTFIGCTETAGTTGAAFVYDSKNDLSDPGLITLENTIFENNNATNGCALMVTTNENPIVRDLIVRKHKNGNFIFTIFFTKAFEEEAVIERCTFEDNSFNTKSESSPDGGGAGIWVSQTSASTTPVTFAECTFKKNYASKYGGAMAFGQSNTLRQVQLTYQKCTFVDNIAGNDGGALWINTESLFVIDDCDFISNSVNNENGKGNAIILKSRTTSIITDTTIVNNGMKGSAIVFEGKVISALDSTIEFDNVNESCRGIEFRNKATIELEGCTFLRCNGYNTENGEGGGIFYHEEIANNLELVFSLDSCVFDSNDALNGSALLLNISTTPEIYGCTFKNHQSGSFIFSIVFSMFQMVYEFTDCTFENNYHTTSTDNEDGGGSGIWIANNKQIAAGRLMQVYFTGVKFINNVSPSVGGAFAYGRSPTVYPTELYFDSCQFDGNTAETDGGALWIITKSPYEIQYCNFKNNYAKRYGGSIMVDTKAPIATIQTSTFEMDTAEIDGNSIYVTDQTPRFILSGNNFIDCGLDKNVITIDTTIAGIEGNTIQFSDELETCRGINLKSAGTFEITDNTFKLCKADQGGGFKYDNVNNKEGTETLIVSGNTFDSCIATSAGCAMYLRVNSAPTFSNNDVDNCRYGTMIIQIVFIKPISEYVLDGFVFKNNEYHNSQGNEDAGGSGFWVDNANSASFTYKFRGVTWQENTASYAGGAFGYGRNTNYRRNDLIFESCTFINNRCKEELGGALWLGTSGEVLIDNCNFTNNKALGTSSFGGAIYFDEICTSPVKITNTYMTKNSAIDANALYLPASLPIIHIDNCEIINNGNLNSAIKSVCPVLLIENSFVGFDKYSLKCRGIEILTSCNFTLRNTNISHCDANEGRDEGGGLRYNHAGQSRSVKAAQESIVIEDCIFTDCKGGNGVACMIRSEGNVVFNRNTVKDCRNGKFIFVIICSNFVENFLIEDCIFKHNLMNNRVDSEDGGGSGIWIANNKYSVPQGSYTQLVFRNCSWLENQASTVGGAFAYGRSLTIVNTAITFDNCQFTDNVAKNREGGALWICTSVPFLVQNCQFQRNKAKGDSPMGGAITVAATAPQINIKNTKFYDNEARDGNAIYVKDTTKDMNITDCTFQDNGIYGSVIANEAKQICVDTSYILFDKNTKACRGINFLTKCTALVRDTHFRNCRTAEASGGGGIFYQNTVETDNEESLTIEGCLFDNCVAPNGCALLAWLETPIILRNNLIWHNTNGKFIVSVFYNKYVNETIVEDCYFEHNFFLNNDDLRDGGGSGLWIANNRGIVPDSEIKKLTFVGCTWRNNTADAYGGAFSYGQSLTVKGMDLEFTDCIFINNTATKTYGGALYIITDKPLIINDCFFDGNKANGIGGAIYFSKFGDVSINDCKFARNNAYEAGAVCCDGRNKVTLNSLIFSENTATIDAPNLLIRHYGASAFDVKNCKFDFNKVIGQAQVVVRNNNYENSEETVNFVGCCFTHSGDAVDETAFHVKVQLVSGSINIGSGNCFDLPEDLSFSSSNNETKVELEEGIFDCHTCTVPSIPTSPPTNMPTQSPSPTPEATPRATDQLPDPTPRPTVDESSTSVPPRTPARTVTPLPTDISSSNLPQPTPQGTTSSVISIDTGNTVSRGKSNKAKTIGMIAGITAAIVVIIVVIIVLLWLFLFRRRNTNGINDEGYKPNSMDNEVSHEVDSTPAAMDDPIWSYQSQENPLYNDNDNNGQNEDENDAFGDDNNFEESWGNTI